MENEYRDPTPGQEHVECREVTDDSMNGAMGFGMEWNDDRKALWQMQDFCKKEGWTYYGGYQHGVFGEHRWDIYADNGAHHSSQRSAVSDFDAFRLALCEMLLKKGRVLKIGGPSVREIIRSGEEWPKPSVLSPPNNDCYELHSGSQLRNAYDAD